MPRGYYSRTTFILGSLLFVMFLAKLMSLLDSESDEIMTETQSTLVALFLGCLATLIVVVGSVAMMQFLMSKHEPNSKFDAPTTINV